MRYTSRLLHLSSQPRRDSARVHNTRIIYIWVGTYLFSNQIVYAVYNFPMLTPPPPSMSGNRYQVNKIEFLRNRYINNICILFLFFFTAIEIFCCTYAIYIIFNIHQRDLYRYQQFSNFSIIQCSLKIRNCHTPTLVNKTYQNRWKLSKNEEQK